MNMREHLEKIGELVPDHEGIIAAAIADFEKAQRAWFNYTNGDENAYGGLWSYDYEPINEFFGGEE